MRAGSGRYMAASAMTQIAANVAVGMTWLALIPSTSPNSSESPSGVFDAEAEGQRPQSKHRTPASARSPRRVVRRGPEHRCPSRRADEAPRSDQGVHAVKAAPAAPANEPLGWRGRRTPNPQRDEIRPRPATTATMVADRPGVDHEPGNTRRPILDGRRRRMRRPGCAGCRAGPRARSRGSDEHDANHEEAVRPAVIVRWRAVAVVGQDDPSQVATRRGLRPGARRVRTAGEPQRGRRRTDQQGGARIDPMVIAPADRAASATR